MRDRAWRRKQKSKKTKGNQTGCTCMMCKPWRYDGMVRHSDLKRTAERVKDLQERYLDEQ